MDEKRKQNYLTDIKAEGRLEEGIRFFKHRNQEIFSQMYSQINYGPKLKKNFGRMRHNF